MQRKSFIRQTGAVVLGLAAFGDVRWQDGRYVGDSLTTTDILGPFYRPGAPLRSDLNPKNYNDNILHLRGRVNRLDGKPASGCKIEIWQCKADGFYDNVSDDFSYRGHVMTGADGRYGFITAQPPPEPTDETKAVYRPAHIHLRISAPKQQDLITQIYFSGDPLLAADPSTKSPLAINRILPVKIINDKESEIRFDVVLGKVQAADGDFMRQVCGIYKMSDNSLMQFYQDNDLLFYKINGQIWGALTYNSDNTFTGMNTEARFVPGENSSVTLHFEFLRRKETRLDGKKVYSYDEPQL